MCLQALYTDLYECCGQLFWCIAGGILFIAGEKYSKSQSINGALPEEEATTSSLHPPSKLQREERC